MSILRMFPGMHHSPVPTVVIDVQAVTASVIDFGGGPYNSNAYMIFATSGICTYGGSPGSSSTYNWATGPFTPSNYQIKVTKTGGLGTIEGVANDSWTSLGSTQTPHITSSLAGEWSIFATISIRDAGTLEVLDTALFCTFQIDNVI